MKIALALVDIFHHQLFDIPAKILNVQSVFVQIPNKLPTTAQVAIKRKLHIL